MWQQGFSLQNILNEVAHHGWWGYGLRPFSAPTNLLVFILNCWNYMKLILNLNEMKMKLSIFEWNTTALGFMKINLSLKISLKYISSKSKYISSLLGRDVCNSEAVARRILEIHFIKFIKTKSPSKWKTTKSISLIKKYMPFYATFLSPVKISSSLKNYKSIKYCEIHFKKNTKEIPLIAILCRKTANIEHLPRGTVHDTCIILSSRYF